MTSQEQPAHARAGHHDDPDRWQDDDFANAWVSRDDGRVDTRLPMIDDTVGAVPYPTDAAISVLDVGAGYGLITTQLLKRFPNATVTLQGVSEPMFGHARERLADKAAQVNFVTSDFSQATWADALGGPYDLVISVIAIHNMYDDGRISRVYKDVHDLLKPGGAFLNLDYAGQAGGVDAHLAWLKDGGFEEVASVPVTDRGSPLAGRPNVVPAKAGTQNARLHPDSAIDPPSLSVAAPLG
jgi:SAM-dependent methyltransferase